MDYLSRAAFARAPFNNTPNGQVQGRPGTLGRNALRAAGLYNVDVALSKNLALTEGIRLQLRVDLFNALNHTNFGPALGTTSPTRVGINTNLDSSTFGSRGLALLTTGPITAIILEGPSIRH